MGNTIQGISRPYVGQNAHNINDVKQVTDKKTGDVTGPPVPQVLRAWAFELAADGSALAPPPPPAGQPGRDPLVIELGQIEVGTRIELISLTDNPAAEFNEKFKGEIFELPIVGYNVANRTATIALNEDQMKEKGIAAGERFILRQVDKDENASKEVHVYLDPNGWAGQNIDEPVAGGGTQRVRGAEIDIAVGVHGLHGNPNPGTMERVLGKQTVDTFAPKLIESNVAVSTDKVSKKEQDAMKGLVEACNQLLGGGNHTLASIQSALNSSASSWLQNTTYKPHTEFLQTLVADPAMFARIVSLTNTARQQPAADALDWNGLHQIANAAEPPTFTIVKLNKAVEPGVTVGVQNSRTGESASVTQGGTARQAQLVLRDVKNGDPLIMTFQDTAGNAGTPYGFRFDDAAKDGKAKSNPLDIRLGGFALRPKPAPTQGT